MPAATLTTSTLELPLKHPFKIARSEESVARTALLRLRWNGLEGFGEAAPIARYDESVETVRQYFVDRPVNFDNPYRLEELLSGDIPPAARGVDRSVHQPTLRSIRNSM